MAKKQYIIGFKEGKQVCLFNTKNTNEAIEIDQMNCDYIGEAWLDIKEDNKTIKINE